MSLTDPAALERARHHTWRFIEGLNSRDPQRALHVALHDSTEWHLSHPFEVLRGPDAVASAWLEPLLAAFPDVERRVDLFFAGAWEGTPDLGPGANPPGGGRGLWCTATGHWLGTFERDWLTLRATGEPAALRFGEFYRFDADLGRIVEARILVDLVDLARQTGQPLLPPARGREWLVPGPAARDGVLLTAADAAQGRESMERVMAMIAGLMQFDGHDLATMGMQRFWHPQMMWHGPGGIGSTRGIGGFQRHHQAPFLHAFPDRKGAGHRARIAEGPYVASTGWPSVRATHAGDYLGVPAGARPIGMRVMDWWRRDGALLRENWVLIDLPHLMLQMGVDLFTRARPA